MEVVYADKLGPDHSLFLALDKKPGESYKIDRGVEEIWRKSFGVWEFSSILVPDREKAIQDWLG